MKSRLIAAALFGALVFALLPSSIVAINDDFGYLRSVVATIQHGRPWTDDWLEPWSASLSCLAALLYHATGSFYLATYGLLGLLGGIGFFGLATLLGIRTTSEARRIVLCALVLTCATSLWKSLEFTSVALYAPCLFVAIWAAETRHWKTFAAAWLVGLAARQSALTWAILPLYHLAFDRRFVGERRANAWRGPLLVILLGLGAFVGLRAGMNLTHAQAVITNQLFSTANAANLLRALGLGASAFLVVAGLAAFAGQWGAPECRRRPVEVWRVVLVAPIAAFFLFTDQRLWVGIEHVCYDDLTGALYLKTLIVLSAAGWLVGRFRIDWRYIVYLIPSLVLLGLHGAVWDYYFLDIAIFAFVAVRPTAGSDHADDPRHGSPAAAGRIGRDIRRMLPVAAFAVVILFHVIFVFELKFAFDRAASLCQLSESTIRAGKLRPADISFAPFGFIAWYWYPYYIAHEGAHTPDIAGFGAYLNQGAVDVGQAYSRPLHLFPRFRHTPPSDRTALIDWGHYRFTWCFWSEFYLLRAPASRVTPAEVTVPAAQFHPTAYPLNDAEWAGLIAQAPTPGH